MTLFFLSSNNLLNCLLILEVITFTILSSLVYTLEANPSRDFLALVIFSVFVLEGVVGLAGLIRVVYFTGKDYIKIKSFLI